jgi:hypothetical protein
MSLSGTNSGEISEHDLESVRDRASLREELKGTRTELYARIQPLEKFRDEATTTLGKLVRLRVEVYMIATAFVALLGAGTALIPWLVKGAVRDVLLSDGIVKLERR